MDLANSTGQLIAHVFFLRSFPDGKILGISGLSLKPLFKNLILK